MKFVLMALLCSFLNGAPLSLKKTPYFHPNASVTIIVFYTPWCPPCKKTLALLDRMKKEHPKLRFSTIDVDQQAPLDEAKKFGLTDTVPYILVADHTGTVVKRFESLPDKTILNALIERLEKGRLENGTLPVDQRVDTWKMDRKGM